MKREQHAGVDRVIDIALESGMIVLQNGGETYRTEETMTSIASSLGARSASAFVTPTVVMLTCVDGEGSSHTRIQRISDRTINLGRIARINELSRRLAGRKRANDLVQVKSLLNRIRSGREHSPAGVVFATALSGFFFSLMFAGTVREAGLAFAIGAVMRLVLFAVAPLALPSFVVSLVGGFVISALSSLAVFAGLVPSSGNVSIACLMSLVPGLAIVNAIRDIIAGDLVAGSARLLEAFVIAAAISLGVAFGIMIFPSGAAWASALELLRAPVPALAFSFLATAAFAYFFHISRYDILWTSLFGALGWLAYLVVSGDLASPTLAYMAGALVVGLLSEVFAVILKKPATVYIVPGIIPFVPGGGMYETMFLAVLGRQDAASSAAFTTLSAAAAIAVGIALASSCARLAYRVRSSLMRSRAPLDA